MTIDEQILIEEELTPDAPLCDEETVLVRLLLEAKNIKIIDGYSDTADYFTETKHTADGYEVYILKEKHYVKQFASDEVLIEDHVYSEENNFEDALIRIILENQHIEISTDVCVEELYFDTDEVIEQLEEEGIITLDDVEGSPTDGQYILSVVYDRRMDNM